MPEAFQMHCQQPHYHLHLKSQVRAGQSCTGDVKNMHTIRSPLWLTHTAVLRQALDKLQTQTLQVQHKQRGRSFAHIQLSPVLLYKQQQQVGNSGQDILCSDTAVLFGAKTADHRLNTSLKHVLKGWNDGRTARMPTARLAGMSE